MKLRSSIIIVLIIFLLISCGQVGRGNNTPVAVKGVLDLRDWEFSVDGLINLDGDWEFYWQHFIFGAEFNGNLNTDDKFFIPVPGAWKGHDLNGEKLPGSGYASYRLIILHDSIGKSMALKLPTISTAYTLLLNGKQIASVGSSCKTKQTSTPEYLTQVIEFEPEGSKTELVFQVSNFRYAKGGLWTSVMLGLEDDIRNNRNSYFYFDLFLFGSILIMGMYHISIFILRRKEKSSLAFGVFCLFISLRLILTGQLFINILFPSIPWSIIVRLEYLTFYLGVPMYLTFIRYLFPKDVSLLFIRIFRIISLLFSLTVVLTPVIIFTETILYFQLFTVIGGLYLTYLHVLTIARKRDHALILFFGFLAVFSMTINDFLFLNGLLATRELFPFGLFIFVLIQAFTLAGRFMRSFTSVEQLSKKIITVDKNYRSIFENSMEGIYQTSLDGKFILANPAFSEILGYESPEELIEKGSTENWYVNDKERDALINDLNANGSIKDYETKVYRKDRKIIDIRVNINTVFDNEGNIQFFEGNIFDITESRQIERLRLEREAAQSANRTKSEFLANMSHEIRTPMNAILGFADLLLDTEEDSEKLKKLSIIKESGENLIELINDILDFSKIEADRIEIEKKNFSLENLLEHLNSLFKGEADIDGLDFSVKFVTPVPPYVFGDEHRLSQILINLIGNALKFTEKGSVSVLCSYNDGNAVLEIKDTGIGIAQEKQDSIFSPFSQADMSTEKKYGGTGLGLSISRKLAELMDGSISIDSSLDIGTTFTLELPLPEGEPEVISNSDEVKTFDSKSSFSRKKPSEMRVLVVEDNKINQILVSSFLDEMNINYDMVWNGREALDILEKIEYDLILLDMQMPVMDGLETISHIRGDERWKNLYVIALTANAMKGAEEEFLDAGCNEYISKPIVRDIFRIRISEILNI